MYNKTINKDNVTVQPMLEGSSCQMYTADIHQAHSVYSCGKSMYRHLMENKKMYLIYDYINFIYKTLLIPCLTNYFAVSESQVCKTQI